MRDLQATLTSNLQTFESIISISPTIHLALFNYRGDACVISYEGYKGYLSLSKLAEVFVTVYENANYNLRMNPLKPLERGEYSFYERNLDLNRKIANKIAALDIFAAKTLRKKQFKFTLEALFLNVRLVVDLFIKVIGGYSLENSLGDKKFDDFLQRHKFKSILIKNQKACDADGALLKKRGIKRSPQYSNDHQRERYFNPFFEWEQFFKGMFSSSDNPFRETNENVVKEQNELEDSYKILGLNSDATPSEIRAAYKKMSVVHHPDKNQNDPLAKERFQRLQNAYEVIKASL